MDLAQRIGTLLRETYRIERVLGEGGMGVVFVATHERLGNDVAIKFLQPELARDEATLRRFFEEARAAARLEHPNVIRVHDVDTDDGAPFMVMELLRGESLATRLRREGKLSPEDAVAIATPILSALEASHRAGIVHRDIKPDNIFLAIEGGAMVPKLLDFGIAKLRDGEFKTATGVAIGTPAYMAPEQAAGRPSAIGPWTDVWSVAVVLYECIAGRMHYEVEAGGGMMAWLTRLATEPPRPMHVSAPDTPSAIATAVDAALQLAPEERTESAALFRASLLRAVGGEDIAHAPTMASVPAPAPPSVPKTLPLEPAPPTPWAAYALAAAALGALLVGGVWFAVSGSGEPTPERDSPSVVTTATRPTEVAPSSSVPSLRPTPEPPVVAVPAVAVPTPTELGGALRAAPDPEPPATRRPRPRSSGSSTSSSARSALPSASRRGSPNRATPESSPDRPREGPVRSRTGAWRATEL